MKNLVLASFIALSFIGTMGAILPTAAHAMPADTTLAADAAAASASTVTDSTGVSTAPASSAAPAAPAAGIPTTGTSNALYGAVMQQIMTLFAWLVGVAAVTLDYSVYYTVITSGHYVGQLAAVGTAWRVLRDIGNIMLIFGFLAIGITTILNVDWYGGGKKMLPMLLVAAVFLNFSLFFAEAIIDTGNLFATQFYTQINGGHMPDSNFLKTLTIKNEGISNKLMNVLGLQKIYGAAQDAKLNALIKGNPWTIGFMGILLFTITAFVLFSLSFIFIARFVILIFLIILAPIGFAGLAVPQLERRAKQWWSKLFEQTITAPILLLMLYIALAVITDAHFLMASSPNWLGFMNGDNLVDFGGIVLSFLVAMGLLIVVVIQSKNLSAFGSGFVMKAANTLTSGATRMAMAPVKFGARQTGNLALWGAKQTGGRAANYVSKKIMTNEKFGATQSGRILATTLGKGGAGFVGLEKATQKKTDAYKEATNKAIEDKNAPIIAAAMQKREAENSKVQVVMDRHAEETRLRTDEVKRLEKIVKDNEASGKNGPEALSAIEDLQKEKKAVETRGITQEIELKKVQAPLIAAVEAETKVTKDLAEAKKKATLAYAGNLQAPMTKNPLTWASALAAGTHSNAAGIKLVKDTLKQMNDTEKLAKLVREQMKNEEKKSEGSSEAGGKEPAKS